MIQCFNSGWGRVQIATLSWLLNRFPHVWIVISSSRMLNQWLKDFLPLFRCLQHGWYVSLLVCWLSRSDIHRQRYGHKMEASDVTLISAWETLISSVSSRSKGLNTSYCWRHYQIAGGGTWATPLTSRISIWFTCRSFNSMFEVTVPAIYWNLISVYSGCLNFVIGVVQACV